MNKANTALANAKTSETRQNIDKIISEIELNEAKAILVEQQTETEENRTAEAYWSAEEAERAHKFAQEMEEMEKTKMAMEISQMARTIEASEDADAGRRNFIESMEDENGELSGWDQAKLYFYDMFTKAGGNIVSGAAGYLIGKK